MIPVFEIKVPEYKITQFTELSGEKHYTDFGTPVPIEYWNSKPDFAAVSRPIIDFLRKQYKHQRIGLRMLGSMEHEHKTLDELVAIIQQLGHDRYDLKRKGNAYETIDIKDPKLFLLEIEVGKDLGLDGEEQIKHALHSFYVYPKNPTRVDLGIVYKLDTIKHTKVVFNGRKEVCHAFKNPQKKPEAVLAVLKII